MGIMCSSEEQLRGVIFLDVDGVLTMTRCLLQDFEENSPELLFAKDIYEVTPAFIVPLERDRIANLKMILDEHPCVGVVLSTTWRLNKDLHGFLLRALHECGINTAERVLGCTPSLSGLEGRGAEIRLWLQQHEQYSHAFCIIDDDHEHSFAQHGLSDNFVKTVMSDPQRIYSREGLTTERAEYAMKLLAQQLNQDRKS